MIRQVLLYGQLGKQYGRTHRLDVSTPAEAIRAMDANFPGFMDSIMQLGRKGYGYRVAHGKKGLIGVEAPAELQSPVIDEIRITPVLEGSKKGGIGQILAAVVLIAASIYTGGTAAAGASGIFGASTATVASSLMSAGIAMAIGGVIQLLSPQPKANKNENSDNPSYIFDGAVNTMAQGHPVPVGYGEMIVGSAVISAGIEVDQIEMGKEAASKPPSWENPSTGSEEDYPPPTLVWDENINNWTLPDGTELLFDEAINYGREDGYFEERKNFRLPDGRVPTFTAATDRWDIPDATVFAVFDPKRKAYDWQGTDKVGDGGWVIRGGSVVISYQSAGKRWIVPSSYSGGESGGGGGGDGSSGDGSGSGGGGSSGGGGGGSGSGGDGDGGGGE